jgi:hypothetical protein
MSLEEHFNPYPHLKAVFWPAANTISWTGQTPHPLLGLVQANDGRAKRVADRTNSCCRAILQKHPNWLLGKAKYIIENDDATNISATLGEIRAFGELIWVWQNKVVPESSGPDFSFACEDRTVRVEVFTPQHGTERNRIEHKPNSSGRIVSQIVEIYPFGWPERPDKDNVQGEAVSNLAAMKQKEHQFDEGDINILWCDLKDPVLWVMGFDRSQFSPLTAFQEKMMSGAFWNAFYAKKGTPIYESLPVEGYMDRKTYIMEFPGRFWNAKSKLDFVIADTAKAQFVFQNPNRKNNIPVRLFRDLHRLHAFDLEASWIDWPCAGQLKSRVNMTLESIAAYEKAFWPDENNAQS